MNAAVYKYLEAHIISGGHTYSGNPNYTGTTAPDPARTPNAVRYYDSENKPIYNVTGGTTAGGLIGRMNGGKAVSCYSTCSASGTTAGGFVGTAASSTIKNSYCTGLVVAPADLKENHGAFAGSGTITTDDGKPNHYFAIINELKDTTNGGYTYLPALGSGEGDNNIKALDADTESYNSFVGDQWQEAKPYDDMLTKYYNSKYNLQTVKQRYDLYDEGSYQDDEKVTFNSSDFDATHIHYGDWPAPEEFVFN